MSRFLSPEKLARASAHNPWLTLGIWVLVVVGAFAGASQLKVNNDQDIRGAESLKAQNLLEDRIRGKAPASETIVVQSDGFAVEDEAFGQFVTALATDLRGLDGTVK